MEQMEETHSKCDVIFEYDKKSGQLMEVVEHILHHVSMVGLHYTYFNQWGVTSPSGSSFKSEHVTHMQEARNKKYYNFEKFNCDNNCDDWSQVTKERVMIQEYAWWVISTGWGIQCKYGKGSGEWTLMKVDDFKDKM